MRTYVKYTYRDIPRRGKPRGGCNENVFCNAKQVFMQSLTGNKLVVKLLAAGGTNGRASCASRLFLKDILDVITARQHSKYAVRRFFGFQKYRWFFGAYRGTWILFTFFVSTSRFVLRLFETHPPSHVSLMLNELLLALMLEYC